MKFIVRVPRSCSENVITSLKTDFLNLASNLNQELGNGAMVEIIQSDVTPGFFIYTKLVTLDAVDKPTAENISKKIFEATREAGITYAPEETKSVHIFTEFVAFPSAIYPERYLAKGPFIFDPEEEAEKDSKEMHKTYPSR